MKGTKQITADGYVAGTNPTVVYCVVVKADASGTTVALKNANTTEYDSLSVGANANARFPYSGGLLFPEGCYIDVDAHTTYATVVYEVI